jgi:gliding motility-associated-like protein
MKKIYCFFLFFCFIPFFGFATHLRAGEITAKRISSTDLTYKVTLTTYTDQINGRAANESQETVSFYFGFATNKVEAYKVSRKKKTLINPTTVCNVYDTTFTFPAPGRYTISCGIVNRNERTINLPQPSENISFFVQSTIVISSSFGLNSTPELLNIPLDSAAIGKRFIHNPGAFDIDGDSLAYRLTTPQNDKGVDTGVGEFIKNYRDPSVVGPSPVLNEAKSGPATFTINPVTGDLVWDVPREIGQYNIAFVIEEWRKAPDGSYIKIGEIVRDMQIVVVESENNRPELTLPADICVEAGQKVEFEVIGNDKDNQVLKLSSNGGVYNLDANGVFFKFIEPEAASFNSKASKSTVLGTFSWPTNCLHVRDQPYNVLFKVEDSPGRFETQLVDIKTMNIKILPPRPTGLLAIEQENGVSLKWKPLQACKASGQVLVYRKSGCSGLNSGECTAGMPAAWGYALVATLTTADSLYFDKSAEKGATYSYRLVTEIKPNQFLTLQSGPSAEFCVGSEIKKGMVVITNVTIEKTSQTEGSILVKWRKPLDFDSKTYKGPYQYKIYRAEGIGGENYTLLHTQTTALDQSADTLYLDQRLNTQDKIYRYKIAFYVGLSELYGTTSGATTVRLSASPDDKSVRLTWEANVPWKNDNQTHFLYRENKTKAGEYNLIAKVKVSGSNTYNYLDYGLDHEPSDGDISYDIQNGQTFCYKVITAGSYEQLPNLGVLLNASQAICAIPTDRTPPCPPVLVATSEPCKDLTALDFCNQTVFSNTIRWSTPATVNGTLCKQDIVSYKIFYTRYDNQQAALLAVHDAKQASVFVHRRNSQDGFAGCYYITAMSNLGIESKISNKICFDNCEVLSFPNVFTPNGDGSNDTFSPMNCPAFVKSIQYEIFNTAGLKVAEGSGQAMDWDGRELSGKALPSGPYYYLVKVVFEKLSPLGSSKTYKGWVNLIR